MMDYFCDIPIFNFGTLGFKIWRCFLPFGNDEGVVDEFLNLGAFLALLASISYGFAANIVQPLIKKYGSLDTLKIALRYGTLFSFIALLPSSNLVLPTVEISLFPILLLGIGSSGIAFLSFYKLIDDVGAVAGSITVYIIPIFSVVFGYVFLSEFTSSIQMVGILIIIISAYQFSKKRN